MKTSWDYSKLANAYLKRPDYSEDVITSLLHKANQIPNNKVCDIGAGVAHLTIMLASKGLDVTAVEPNDAMRNNGISRTRQYPNITWYEGTGESTGQASNAFDLVTFGSSFNVCDRAKALQESSRILKDNGWFFCLWNHRDLSDPLQASIEEIIKRYIDGYGYGTRREDQTEIILKSNLFHDVSFVEGSVTHSQTIDECIEAWRSHATLSRQAGDKFDAIIKAISDMLKDTGLNDISIPYTTRAWIAQKKR